MNEIKTFKWHKEFRQLNEFIKVKCIGEGSYSIVYETKDTKNNEIVALKKLKYVGEYKDNYLREIEIVAHLNHDNLIKLKDIIKDESIWFSFEFCTFCLSEIIDDSQGKKFQQTEIKCIMKQLFSGLHYLHSYNIIHRDLSMSNILFTCEGCLKIIDFGQARFIDKTMSPEVGSRWYRAPELLFLCKAYDYSIDIWSSGCIFAELLQKKPLFPGKSDCEMISLMIQLLGTPNENNWPGVSEFPLMQTFDFQLQPHNYLNSHFKNETEDDILFLQKLICYNSKKRLSADQCLNDSYFYNNPLPCSQEELSTILNYFNS